MVNFGVKNWNPEMGIRPEVKEKRHGQRIEGETILPRDTDNPIKVEKICWTHEKKIMRSQG